MMVRSISEDAHVRIESGNIAHRLIGLIMAVIMPLCCCSTQVLGQVVVDDRSVIPSIGSCCGGPAVANASDCNQTDETHDRCDCVRGHLDGGVDTTSVMGHLASPAVAHPSVGTTPLCKVDRPSSLVEVAAAANGPPHDPGSTPSARRLHRILILQN